MHSRRLALVAAVLSLVVIAVFVYHSRSKKSVSAVPSVNPTPTIAASKPVAQPQLESPPPAIAATPAKRPERLAPINERWGQMQPSNDLIVAFMRHEELGLTKEEMEDLLTAYLEVGRERSCYEASIATVEL